MIMYLSTSLCDDDASSVLFGQKIIVNVNLILVFPKIKDEADGGGIGLIGIARIVEMRTTRGNINRKD
jgi:hypothetical protein